MAANVKNGQAQEKASSDDQEFNFARGSKFQKHWLSFFEPLKLGSNQAGGLSEPVQARYFAAELFGQIVKARSRLEY